MCCSPARPFALSDQLLTSAVVGGELLTDRVPWCVVPISYDAKNRWPPQSRESGGRQLLYLLVGLCVLLLLHIVGQCPK